jgi:predicted glycoside hydrolase/deacetylase ChbG (UPF0249 family)
MRLLTSALLALLLAAPAGAEGPRRLIIHADDLGMSHSVNRATFEALEKGWITSASILVPCPWFPEVVRWARAHPQADLGLHLALNSEWTTFRWRPLSSRESVPSLLDPDGYLPLVETTVAQRARPAEAEQEVRAQIEAAQSAGIKPTHLDPHMGALLGTRALFDVYRGVAKRYGLPQSMTRRGPRDEIGVEPQEALLDQVVQISPGVAPEGWRAAYEKMLAPLPPGTYQLVVHLGYDDDEMRGATADHPDWGARWRQLDLDVVKSPEFQAFLKREGFQLVGWKDLAAAH